MTDDYDRGRSSAEGHTQAAIDEAEMQVYRRDEMRMALRECFIDMTSELQEIGLLNLRDPRLGSTEAEIAEGAADEASEIFERMVNRIIIQSAEQILKDSGDE